MASFSECVDASVSAGRITKEVGEAIKNAQDPETELNRLVADASRQKRETAIQALRQAQAWEDIQSHPDGAYSGLMAVMGRDPKGKAAFFNVDYLTKTWQGKLHSRFAEGLSRFRTRVLGLSQDEEGLRKFVRALYGEQVDDPEIMGLAEDWRNITEFGRTEFNRRGGSISKNEKWLLPQGHDKGAIGKVSKEEWREFSDGLMDREQMVDDLGRPLSDEDFNKAMDFVYDTVTTGGMNKTKPFTIPNLGKKLSRRNSERRFIYFKDADSWLAYQERFGRGDVFTNLTDWLDTTAHDIALMERMGTDPENTFKVLKNQVEREAPMTERQRAFSNSLFNVVSGKTNEGELTGMADFLQSGRNLLTASTLGGAFLSALTDVGFVALTSRYNNIPTFKVLSRQMELLNPANEADRIQAVKLGLIAEAWTTRANGSNRYADVYGTGITAKLAEGVMRGSLLSPWTDAGRKAFGMEFASMLAENFGKSLDELDESVRRAFTTYGIDAAEWDTFRKTKPIDFKGAKFADMTQEGGEKFQYMVLAETDFAVPTPDARVRAITTGGTGRATVGGQMFRSVMMLKSFPITIALTHFYRGASQATMSDKLAYFGMMMATTSVLGGVALHAKDVAAGREPRPVDGDFVGASIAQGGGLGIFGDFIFSDVNRFGGGITATLIGPTGELVDTTTKLTLGNIREAVAGEETNVLGESAQFLKRYTPDIWQTRLMTDAMFDQIEMLANPDAQRRFNATVKKRYAEYDQGYWWRPGAALPEFAKQ